MTYSTGDSSSRSMARWRHRLMVRRPHNRKLFALPLVILGVALATCSCSGGTGVSASTGSSRAGQPSATASSASSASSPQGGGSPASAGAASAAELAAAYAQLLNNTEKSDPFCGSYGLYDDCVIGAELVTSGDNGSSFEDMAVGTVTTKGDRAIITLTGKSCSTDACTNYSDPDWIAKSGVPFNTAYNDLLNNTGSLSASSSGVATTGTEVDGRWYWQQNDTIGQ